MDAIAEIFDLTPKNKKKTYCMRLFFVVYIFAFSGESMIDVSRRFISFRVPFYRGGGPFI